LATGGAERDGGGAPTELETLNNKYETNEEICSYSFVVGFVVGKRTSLNGAINDAGAAHPDHYGSS
jgi:hypothetical protein